MTEALAHIRLVKAFGREDHEDGRANDRLESVFRMNMRGKRVEGVFGRAATACFVLALSGAAWYGGRHVLRGSLSAGSLLAFLMISAVLSGPMAGMSSQYARLQKTFGAADRLFDLLDTAPEPPDAVDAHPFPDGRGHIRFVNLQFAYTPESPVLHGLTLEVPAGCVTVLVGASGAGKTTLAMLLLRFYSPQSGRIEIDGVPIDRIRRHELREHIGIVPQEPMLFSGTIRENIRYGRLGATDAEVEAAAGTANVEEFVAPLPLGYETVLGERGITLSGGQRQRIAVARVVLKAPRILILDEATSALDTRSEQLVREALERLRRERTTLVIAHRLTTIQEADRIVVIDKGRVVESGTHADLLDLGRYYALLYGPAVLNETVSADEGPLFLNSGGSTRS